MKRRVKRKGRTPLGLKYIKRHECSSTRGWRVTFLERHNVAPTYWADRKHGGRQQALAKALAWRDAMMRKHRIPATHRRLPVPWTRCSPSGIRGVYLNYYGRAYVAQIAEAPGHYPQAYFGFATHGGKREALIAAVRHRVTNEVRLYGSIVSPLPAWLAAEVGVKPSRKQSTARDRGRDGGPAARRRGRRTAPAGR